MTVGKLIQPIRRVSGGKCLTRLGSSGNLCWYPANAFDLAYSSAVPYFQMLYVTVSGTTANVGTKIGARSLVCLPLSPTPCSGSDIYQPAYHYIDIMKALYDGIWSSSVTIGVYAIRPSSASGSIICGPAHDPTFLTDCSASKAVTVPGGTGCPSTLVATITVNEDGTFSIA